MKMRHRMLFLFVTLLSSLSTSQSAIASSGECYHEHQLQKRFRKQEAISIVEDLTARLSNALDNILISVGQGAEFVSNVNYVIDLQLHKNKMDVMFDNVHITDDDDFKAIWSNLAQIYQYRKRLLTNFMLVDYKENKHCLRKVTLQIVGTSFGILRSLPTVPQNIIHTSENFVDFYRFVITWVEKCPGQFRVKKIVLATESSFPLPDGASMISSPLNPGASGVYVPPTVKSCQEESSLEN